MQEVTFGQAQVYTEGQKKKKKKELASQPCRYSHFRFAFRFGSEINYVFSHTEENICEREKNPHP